MADIAFGAHFPIPNTAALYVDIEIHDGVGYVSLNDHYRYRATSEALKQTQHGLRRNTATSEMFDGEVTIHTTRSNINETVEVYVKGVDHVDLNDNIDRLVEMFSQRLYNVRRIFGQDVQIWTCFPAEYAIDQSHVYIHNTMAKVTFSVPRMPKVTREVLD